MVTDGKWHHVVLTGARTTQSLYLDGVLAGSLTGTISNQALAYSYLGAGYASSGWMGVPSGTYRFTGRIDEAALYRKALTADQVADHYQARQRSGLSSLAATINVTDPLGNTVRTSYDALKGMRPTTVTDSEGATTTYRYDTGGFRHTVTDPNGHSTITGHDKRGNTVTRTVCRDADSCWTTFTDHHLNPDDALDPRNDKPVAVRDARSSGPDDNRYRTTQTYTALGLPSTTTLADTRSSTTTYTTGTEPAVGGGTTPAGLVARKTTPGGAVTSHQYFATGSLARTVSPSGLITEFSYDGLGRKVAEKQISDAFPDGVTTEFTYDEMSRTVSESGVGVKNELTGRTHTAEIARAYDPDGNLLSESVEDTSGGDARRTTGYHYDSHGRNDTVTDAENNVTTLTHDALGRVTGTTDPVGTRHTYAYTPQGRHAETVLKGWTGAPGGEARDLVMLSNAYDPAGRLASSTDAMGATTAFTYFDDGLLATSTARQVTQADGSRRDIALEANSYDGAGHLTRQVTGGGRVTVNRTVDATGRVTRTVLDPDDLNRITDIEYDDDDRVTKECRPVDGSGKRLSMTAAYDDAGNVVREELTDGTSTHITTGTYDQRGLALTTVTPRGNADGADPAAYTTTYRYDALGRLVEARAPEVSVEEMGAAATTARPATLTGYNTFGEATDSRDARGAVTRMTVDGLGAPTSVTLPDYTPPGGTKLSAVSRTTYDALGRPATTTDPLGRTSRYAYDQLGNLISSTDPVAGATPNTLGREPSGLTGAGSTDLDGAGVSEFTWTPTGLQLSATGPTGARTEATYDELGRRVTDTIVERYPSLQNLTTRYVWDDAGNQTSATTPGGRTTRATYNAAGEATTTTDPGQGVTRLGYDRLGRQTQTIDPTDRRSTFTFDALGNITAAADHGTGQSVLRTMAAEFDADGNRTAGISATLARTTYTFDALGRMTGQVEPVADGKTITSTFGYDAQGNRTRLTDGRGNSTTYMFNSWNLPESTVEPATPAHPALADRTWTTVYDKAGQDIADLLPGGVERRRAFDGLGRLVEETGTGAEAATNRRTLVYDLAGRLTGAGGDQPAAGNTYTYNDRGQLLTAAGPGGQVGYGYDADGNMTQRVGADASSFYGYDDSGRIDWVWDSISDSDIWYDFDAAGRPLLEEYAVKPEGSTEYVATARRDYTYDSLGRLASDRITNMDKSSEKAGIAYEYNLDDLLTKKTTSGTAGAGQNTYQYDRSGRMTSWTSASTTTAYGWDDAGNRIMAGGATASYDARNRLTGDSINTYEYTARGTLETVTGGTGAPRELTFDAFERKIRDGQATYSYDALDRVARQGTTAFSYDGGSNNLLSDGTSVYSRTPHGALLASRQGTAAAQWAITDRHTDVVAGLSPDGSQVMSSTAYDPFGQVRASNGTTTALGFQSGWTDEASGDVNMASRWYQPGTGGFSSRDTWQLDPSPSVRANRYLYGNAGPLNGIDPSGHDVLAPGRTQVPYVAGSGGGLSLNWSAFGMLGRFAIRGIRGGWGIAADVFLNVIGWNTPAYAPTRPSDPPGGGGGGGGGGRGVKQPPGKSGLYRIEGGPRTGTGTAPATSAAGGGARGGCVSRCIIVPPKPPIDQNVNNGPNPRPAVDRPAPKPDWDPRNSGWKSGDGWDMIVGALDMLGLVNNGQFTPDQAPDTHPAPGADPGSGSGRDNSGDCRGAWGGWRKYGPVDTLHGNRATGVEACLDESFLAANPGTKTQTSKIAPPGYTWAAINASNNGNRPAKLWRNACQLLGKQLGGDGLRYDNLSTCSRSANATPMDPRDPGQSPNMVYYENMVKEAVGKGMQIVHYKVTPLYEGNRVVPTAFRMQARGVTAGGAPGIQFDDEVQNIMYGVNNGRFRNLGRAVPEGYVK